MRLHWILLWILGVAGCSPTDAEIPGDAVNSTPAYMADVVNSVGMELVQIPAGGFTTETGFGDSKNTRTSKRDHPITLSQPFYMGAFEVTQSQYEKVMGGNPSLFQGIDGAAKTQSNTSLENKSLDTNRPVENITWKQAVEFCNRLSELPEEKAAGRIYRLPTEAEWEYAYRAGASGPVLLPSDAKEVDKVAWWHGNSARKTHPVGQKSPNAWRLFDMTGNVLEYCSDFNPDDSPQESMTDPKGPKRDRRRRWIVRGGHYESPIDVMTSNLRSIDWNPDPAPWIGFRVVMQNGNEMDLAGLLGNYWEANPELLIQNLQLLQTQWNSAMPLLAEVAQRSATTDTERNRRFLARVALASQDPIWFDRVFEDFTMQHLQYFNPMTEILKPQFNAAGEQLKQVLLNQQAGLHRRLFAVQALHRSAPDTILPLWDSAWEKQFTQALTQRWNDESTPELHGTLASVCRDVLRPYRDKLRSELIRVFEKPPRNKLEIDEANQAMAVLADFFSDDPWLLTDLLINAPPGQRGVAMDAIRRLYKYIYQADVQQIAIDRSAIGPEILEKLSQVVQTPPPNDLDASQRVQFARRRVNAASYFFEQRAFDKVLPIFDWKDDPEAIAQWLLQRMADGEFLEFVSQLPPGNIRDTALHATLLANPDPPAGSYSDNQKFFAKVLDWYTNDPNSAIHGAARWFLKQKSQHLMVDKVDENPVPYSRNREWFTIKIPLTQHKSKSVPLQPHEYTYLTFVVFQPGEYVIEPMEIRCEQNRKTSRKTLVLHRPVAILDREISPREWEAFRSGRIDDVNAHPMECSWYNCVAFCRWLTAQAGMEEASQVYADPKALDENSVPFHYDSNIQNFPNDWPFDLDKAGFRLPTETEWEVAARGGTSTAYGFGNDESLLPNYAWSEHSDYRHMSTSTRKSRWMDGRSLRPNFRGLFDMHGNYEEWVNDWSESPRDAPERPVTQENQQRCKILRGGGANDMERTRSGARAIEVPSRQGAPKSFRLAITLPPSPIEVLKKPE